MKKLIGFLLSLFLFLNVSGQIDSNTVMLPEGHFGIFWKPFNGTLAQLDANTNTTYLTATITNLGGGVFIKVANNSLGYNEDMVVYVIDQVGQVWKRNFDGKTYYTSWVVDVNVPDTQNVTINLQTLINILKDGDELIWDNKRAKTRFGSLFLPTRSIVYNINGANISPPINAPVDFGMFSFFPVSNSLNTGLYTGSAVQAVTPVKRKVEKIVIKNAIVDLEYGFTGFVLSSVQNCNNTVINSFTVENNIVKRFSNRAVANYADQLISDTSGKILNYNVLRNDIRDGGVLYGLALILPATNGDTSIYVKTIDNTPIIDKLSGSVGRSFNISSHYTSSTSPALDASGFATTNKILRVKRYVISDTSERIGRIDFSGGSYDDNNGFQDSLMGITAPVITNAVLLPTSEWNYPLMFTLPNYSGSAGSTRLVPQSHSTYMDALGRNMIPGMKIMINSQPGFFTVVRTYYDSIIIDKPLGANITFQTARAVGKEASAFTQSGYSRTVNYVGNVAIGNGHHWAISAVAKPKTFNQDLDNVINFTDNYARYAWMTVEITRGVTTSAVSLTSGYFNNVTLTKNANWITLTNPANYRVSTKNFGYGSVKFMTNAAVIDANATLSNTLQVGDKVYIAGIHERMQITDFDDVTPGVLRMKVARYDFNRKDTVAGGINLIRPSITSSIITRVYNDAVGEGGSIYTMNFLGENNFGYTLRNGGGAGYHISGVANIFNIGPDNKFYQGEDSPFELEGNYANIQGPYVENRTFTGEAPIPSLSMQGSGGGRGAQGLGIFYTKNLVVQGGIYRFIYPPTGNWNSSSGSYLLAPSSMGLSQQNIFNITGGNYYGIRQRIYNIQNITTLDGIGYPDFYYNDFSINSPSISVPENFSNFGFYSYFVGKSIKINGINVTKPLGTNLPDFKLFLNNQKPNPALFDSSNVYDIKIQNNIYPAKPDLNNPYNPAKVLWLDIYNVGNYKFIGKDTINVATGSGGGSIEEGNF